MSNTVYEIPRTIDENLAAKLLYVTKSRYDKDWHSTIHTHHFTELLYVINGRGTVIVGDEEIQVTECDLVIINPYSEHTEKSITDTPLEYIALGIEGLIFSPPKKTDSPIAFYNYKDEQEEYLFYLEQLLEEVQTKQDHYPLAAQNVLNILLIKIFRKNAFTVEKTVAQKLNKDIAYVKNYIEQSFSEEITLDSLAKLSHINKYYLAHSFKTIIGVSPIEYLISIRIRESKILLKTTNYPISYISVIVGFSSQSFFSQSFKRVTTMTPSKYRKRSNQKTEDESE